MSRRKLQNYLEYFFYRSIRRWLEARSVSRALEFHRFLAWFWYEKLQIRRDVARENLRASFPNWSEIKIDRVLKNCFLHFSRVMVEQILLPKILKRGLDEFVECSDWSPLERIMERGCGAILVGGHLGNWEMMGCAIAHRGFPLQAVAFEQRNRLVGDLFNEHRLASGMGIIPRGKARREIPRLLSRGALIGLIADQDAGKNGIFVPFLGRMASTPAGPAVYCLRYDVPLVYSACIFTGTKYQLVFDELDTAPFRTYSHENVVQLTRLHVRRLEEDILKYPEQWFWMHRRWKTEPPA